MRKKREKTELPRATAIVAAAGSSQRMGGMDKLLMLLAGRPVLAWALDALERSASIERIVIVTRPEKFITVQDLCR